MIPPAHTPSPAWARFHAAVLADDTLLARLLATPDAATFRTSALGLAAELGLALPPAELDAALVAARHAWITRNLPP